MEMYEETHANRSKFVAEKKLTVGLNGNRKKITITVVALFRN